MKKGSLLMLAIISCLFISTNVNAKSLRGVTMRSRTDTQHIVKYNTEALFHTSVLATSMNSSKISIENTVQRKNSKGNWVNKAQVYPLVQKLNVGYETNFNLYSTADTRSIWVNVTDGTTLVGDLYINNGHA